MEVRLIAIVDRSRYYFKRACSVKEIVVLRNGDQAFWFFFLVFIKHCELGHGERLQSSTERNSCSKFLSTHFWKEYFSARKPLLSWFIVLCNIYIIPSCYYPLNHMVDNMFPAEKTPVTPRTIFKIKI